MSIWILPSREEIGGSKRKLQQSLLTQNHSLVNFIANTYTHMQILFWGLFPFSLFYTYRKYLGRLTSFLRAIRGTKAIEAKKKFSLKFICLAQTESMQLFSRERSTLVNKIIRKINIISEEESINFLFYSLSQPLSNSFRQMLENSFGECVF